MTKKTMRVGGGNVRSEEDTLRQQLTGAKRDLERYQWEASHGHPDAYQERMLGLQIEHYEEQLAALKGESAEYLGTHNTGEQWLVNFQGKQYVVEVSHNPEYVAVRLKDMPEESGWFTQGSESIHEIFGNAALDETGMSEPLEIVKILDGAGALQGMGR